MKTNKALRRKENYLRLNPYKLSLKSTKTQPVNDRTEGGANQPVSWCISRWSWWNRRLQFVTKPRKLPSSFHQLLLFLTLLHRCSHHGRKELKSNQFQRVVTKGNLSLKSLIRNRKLKFYWAKLHLIGLLEPVFFYEKKTRKLLQ